MSETKWAAGPWAYDPIINRVYSVPTNMLVATVWLGGLVDTPSADPEWPANARMIAAAPEMYEALRLAQMALADRKTAEAKGYTERACRVVGDALAKAEGRS